MRLVVSEFVTADGVFEDPGGSEGTEFGSWSIDYGTAESFKYKEAELKSADAQLLGRVTYQGFADAWPKRSNKDPFAKKFNQMPKHVVSSTLSKLDWENSHFVKGDLVTGIKNLKKQYKGDVLVYGSGQLVRFLLDKNLVDMLSLMVHPIIFGKGKLLFDGLEKRHNLTLKTTKKFPNGVVVLEYEPNK